MTICGQLFYQKYFPPPYFFNFLIIFLILIYLEKENPTSYLGSKLLLNIIMKKWLPGEDRKPLSLLSVPEKKKENLG